MALFKISRGKKQDFEDKKSTIKDGNAYFITDNGKFYIDVGATDGETGTVAVEGNTPAHPSITGANRICINPISQEDYNTLSGELDTQVEALNSSITSLDSAKADDFTILNCGDSNC